MPHRDPTRQSPMLAARRTLERTKGSMLMTGVAAVVAGTLAIGLPDIAARLTGYGIGGVMIMLGIGLCLRTLSAQGMRSVVAGCGSGVAVLLLSGAFLARPDAAVAALASALGVVLLAHASGRTASLLREDDDRWRSRALAAGVLAAGVAAVFATGWPGSALWATGTVGGLALFFAGFWLIRAGTAHDTDSAHNLSGRWPRS